MMLRLATPRTSTWVPVTLRGDVVAPLADVGTDFSFDGEPAESVEQVGSSAAIEVLYSGTVVDIPLADILASDHSIVVHESADDMGTLIACGAIGGSLVEEADIPVGLGPLSDSGYSGVAWLSDNFDGTTGVIVFLTPGAVGSTMAATGDSDGESGANTEGVSIDIVNFAFDPQTVELSVGDTATWTNQDGAAHTVTLKPSGSGFQSGTLQGGDSFSHTFEEPGTYEYFCEFHANMTGTVTVSE